MSYELIIWILILPAGFYLAVIGWEIWEGSMCARLIPQEEIDQICRALITEYGERAISRTHLEEDRALYETDMYRAAKWRRIRARLMKSAPDLDRLNDRQ